MSILAEYNSHYMEYVAFKARSMFLGLTYDVYICTSFSRVRKRTAVLCRRKGFLVYASYNLDMQSNSLVKVHGLWFFLHKLHCAYGLQTAGNTLLIAVH